MTEFIHTDKAPKAVGPYSQAIVSDNFIFCSGQIGIDPSTNALVEGIENQTRQALVNLGKVLQEAGASTENVIKTTIFLKNIEDFSAVNVIYEDFFGNHKPARSTIEVSNLPKNALVEIEAIAVKNG